MMIASVIVDVKNKAVDKTYDYRVPSNLDNLVFIGQRVLVSFNNQLVLGFIIELKEKSEYENLLEIKELLDITPCLNKELVDLAYNMHNYYFSLYINCLLTMIPPALRIKHTKKFVVLNRELIPFTVASLFEKDFLVYDNTKQEYLSELMKGVNNGSLLLTEEVEDKNSIKFDTYIKLKDFSTIKLNDKQQEIVDYLRSIESIELKNALQKKYSSNRIKLLIDKGVLEEIKKEHYRGVDDGKEYNDKKVILNETQQIALEEIRSSYGKTDTILLHGVTGSGKTEIYLRVLDDMLKQGKEAILLVPEISLTWQIVSRIKGRFGSQVALLHSGLSIGEKYDEWRKIRRGDVKIVVGARSAIFAPLKNIGAIIVDEEHEKSYIQSDKSPQYDAKMIARIRARNHGAITIFGSATPSVSSYYYALNNRYKLVNLDYRANLKDSPSVIVVDMKDELKKGNTSVISNFLHHKIDERLAKNEQVMLLLNRRGFSSYIICRECNNVIKCPHCNVSLTYHRVDDTMRCHYCDYKIKKPIMCPSCASKRLRYMGSGTEKVVDYLTQEFTNARIIRMDADNTRNKGAHEEIIQKFESDQADILVGTQMIAKGLDFTKVSLVGILNADLSLCFPAFDATNDAYNLFVQVTGRAGRHDTEGLSIIQAYDTNNYVIEASKKEDYLSFYKQEIEYRKMCKYPPFRQMIEILVIGSDYDDTYNEALKIMSKLRQNSHIESLGPAEDIIVKIQDKYRFKITVKYINESDLASSIIEIYNEYLHNQKYNVQIIRR